MSPSYITMKDGQQISKQLISDLICCALEGGSNYWYVIDKAKSKAPPNPDINTGFWHLDWPLCEGGEIYIIARDHKAIRHLNLEAISIGLELMKEEFTKTHWKNFIEDDSVAMDAETGDVFLQLCVLGELVFG